MELTSAYDYIQSTDDTVNGLHIVTYYIFPLYKEKIVTFLCPSDGNAKSAEFSPNNYGEILADMLLADGNSHTNDSRPTETNRAIRTVFAKMIWRDMSFINDGTSNTLALSELTIDVAGSHRVKGGLMPLASAGMAGNPSVCNPAALLSATDKNMYKGPTFVDTSKNTNRTGADRNPGGNLRGSLWVEGRFPYFGINTILPPNSTSCARQTNAEDYYVLNSASSYHSGGVNAALFDGSVRFVPDTVNAGTDTASNEPTVLTGGKSPYGVWRAIGTPNDGESVAL
jgi:prepilin-type processing-associated H-X9-DG protein